MSDTDGMPELSLCDVVLFPQFVKEICEVFLFHGLLFAAKA